MKIRLICTLLCGLTLLGLTGCTREPEAEESDPGASAEIAETALLPEELAGAAGGVRYRAADLDLPGSPDVVHAMTVRDDAVYLSCAGYDDSLELFTEAERWFVRMDPDGTGGLAFGHRGAEDHYIQDIQVDEGGNIWLLTQTITYDTGGQNYAAGLSKYSPEGNLLEETGLDFLPLWAEMDIAADSMVFGGDGRIYFLCSGLGQGMLIVLEDTGALPREADILFGLEVEGYFPKLLAGGDGTVYVAVFEDGESLLYPAEEGRWGGIVRFDTLFSNAFWGEGEYDLYFDDGTNLYGYTRSEGEAEKLLNWTQSGITHVTLLLPLADAAYVTVGYDTDGLVLRHLTPSDVDLADVEIITLATILNPRLERAVVEFNSSQEEIIVEVLDYGAYISGYDLSTALTRLTTDLLTGEIPDLLDLTMLPAAQYAASGLLTDLNALIDGDPDFDREAVWDNVLTAYEIGGSLYELPLDFTITTMAALTRHVGDRQGWTLEEFDRLLEETGIEPFGLTSRDFFLETVVASYSDVFIDWTSGVCSFDSPAFMRLLALCADMPEGDIIYMDAENYEEYNTYQAIHHDEQLLLVTDVSGDLFSIRRLRGLFGGEDFTFIGYPGLPGTGSFLSTYTSVGITEPGEHKAAAWTFLKSTILSETFDAYMGIPLGRAPLDRTLDSIAAEEVRLRDAGEQHAMALWGETTYAPYEPEADRAVLLDFIGVQTVASRNSDALLTIIREESAAYFAGDRSVEDTARIIQNRAQTYVSEGIR